MEDCSLLCNISTCRRQLVEKIWVTRCLHVFCYEHGQRYFLVASHQISCPVCDSVNSKQVDIVCCDASPHEMFLSGVSPERALNLASLSVKLWSRQLNWEKNFYLNNLNSTLKKLHNVRSDSQKQLLNTKCSLETQLSCIKKSYSNLLHEFNQARNELESTKMKLVKYQSAYGDLLNRRKNVNAAAFGSLSNDFENHHDPGPYLNQPFNFADANDFMNNRFAV